MSKLTISSATALSLILDGIRGELRKLIRGVINSNA
jgi:hypothetical protein